MSEYTPVAEVERLRNKINTRGEISSKGSVRTVNLKTGGTTNVCDATLKDETGEVNLALWGEDIEKVNVGDQVVITNGYTTEFRGKVSLNIGKYGKMEVNP